MDWLYIKKQEYPVNLILVPILLLSVKNKVILLGPSTFSSSLNFLSVKVILLGPSTFNSSLNFLFILVIS